MKNLLLSSVVLLVSYSAMAQLYVTPNGATDSYVYVSDEVLFVEQDVNLVANNTGTTEASIYLRDEAQLIQGATASANSGTGFISVYQDSNSDSYDYNFWSSPVGNQSLAGSGNVNFGVLNLYDANSVTDSDQALVTAGYNGSPSPNLTISRRWLYKRPAGGGYQALFSNFAVPAGMGFTMKGVGDSGGHGNQFVDPMNQNYDFRGRPNNGTIAVAVMNNESTLSGNPYPSAIDLFEVYFDADNTEIGEFRFWDEDRSINSHYYVDNKGGYATWIPGSTNYATVHSTGGVYTRATFLNYDNSGNPSGGSTGMGEDVERLYSPIGQGFNIFATAAGDGLVYFKNSHRVYETESGSPFSTFRTPQGGSTTGVGTRNTPVVDADVDDDPYAGYPPTMRLYTMFGESHLRDMVLILNDEATDGYDRGMDARHPMDGAKAEIYFPIVHGDNGPKPYVIQSLPYSPGKKVPITFEIEIGTPVKITAVEQINLPSRAYLWDSVGNTYQEITNGNEAELLLHEGTFDNRFFIVFRGGDPNINPGLMTGTRAPEVIASVDFFQNNPASQLEVANPEGYDIKSASIFDMSGKLVLNQQDLGNSNYFTFSTATFSDGVYIVKLITEDDITIDYRMTVHNKR